MSDYLILDGDQGIATFKAAEDNNCTVYIKPILRTSDFRFRYLFLKPAWSLH